MKAILVGDMHCVAEEIPECERLVGGIYDLAKEHQVPYVIFLGDQYHTFATVNVYVQDFWAKSLSLLKSVTQVIMLTGNHDQTGANTDEITHHALKPHAKDCLVVDKPMLVDGLALLPYYSKEAIWTDKLKSLDASKYHTIVSHQAYNGFHFENGLLIKDGFSLVTDKPVISGHIHKSQGKPGGTLWYPGSPRWRYLSDANEVKGVYLVDLDGFDTKVLGVMDSAGFCSPIYKFEITKDSPLPVIPKGRVTLDIKGSEAFVKEMVELYKDQCKIRTTIENVKPFYISSQKDVAEALNDYIAKKPPLNGSTQDLVFKEIKSRMASA